jgi:hypothetical protein
MAYAKKEGDKPVKDEAEDERILREAREYLKECIDEEEDERIKMQDDLRFCTLDQWPEEVRKEREADIENGARPCLTIDKINQYIVQVVNDMRQGKPGINVRPQDDSADVETAKILKGLIRNIEDQSSADIPYSVAGESAAKIGLGYFRITTEYVSEDSFDQDIFIRPIANTFSVYLGKHIMPDGSDAEIGFICESMPIDKFKELYPKAKVDQKEFDGLDSKNVGYWRTAETITVVEEYCFDKSMEELYFLADGTTMGKRDYDAWPEEAGPKEPVVERRMRQVRQLKWRKMTGVEVLDKRDLPGKYIPIVEVIGRESWVDGKRVVWGLVRPAKDSLRMYNYWASTITEKMALAPKTPYVGATGQFKSANERWKKANRVNFAYLEYDAIDVNGTPLPAPQRVGPTPIEAALLKQMEVIEHDVQTSLGMFKAAVGETESQQSGRAILALQRESDTGTYHFGANLGISIRHAGRIILDLIPHYYDQKRIVRILGEDGEVQTATLDPNLEMPYARGASGAIFNPTMGKYDVSITVGPSYNTKRMEAAATFVELAKGAGDPATAAVMSYLTVRNSDFNGADEASRMLRALLPPQVTQALQGDAQIPPAAQAQIAQLTQATQLLQAENQELKSGAQQQQLKVQADHDAKMKQLALDREVEEAKARLAREKAIAEFELKKLIAGHENELAGAIADAENSRAERKLSMEQEQRERDEAHKRAEQTKTEEVSAAPNFTKALSEITQAFATALGEQRKSNDETMKLLAEAIRNPAPREVTLGAIKRNDAGIVSAKATIQ